MNAPDPSRRSVLTATVSAGAALLAGCIGDATSGGGGDTTDALNSSTNDSTTDDAATDTSTPEQQHYVDYDGYLADANGWDGPGSTLDQRGESEVHVGVGVGDGGLGFGPVAVRIDPGTTVVWVWESAGHAVGAMVDEQFDDFRGAGTTVADDASTPGSPLFESDVRRDGTFEWTAPDVDAVVPYECRPHAGQGMKGALAIGDVPTTTDPATPEPTPTDDPGESEPGTPADALDVDEWLADTENYDAVVDETDASSVTVVVGEGIEDEYGFSPPAVRVAAGTTVEWVWRSSGHNVSATAGAEFESIIQNEGDTFEWTVPSDLGSGHTTRTATEPGTPARDEDVVAYHCEPHSGMGMKGVIVVE